MAKDRNAAQRRRVKMQDNRAGILTCSTPGCENEYYIAKVGYPSMRVCRSCYETATVKIGRGNMSANLENVLKALKLI